MANLLSSTAHRGTRSSGPLATNNGGPSTSAQGTTLSNPPPQGPLNEDLGEQATLKKVFRGLREHVPELYGMLRDGPKFDPDVAKIILDIIYQATGGGPWPARLAIQAVLFIADNALQMHVNATESASMKATLNDVTERLKRLKDLQVPDDHQEKVKEVHAKLVAAAVVIDDLVRRSTWTCRTFLDAFFCAQCIAKDFSGVSADLKVCLDRIKDILLEIMADRTPRICNKAPEVPHYLVGMQGPALDVLRFLRNSGEKTRVVGLHGQGGIGKSTLMKVVHTNLSGDSLCDDSTHKMAFVEVGMQPSDLKILQQSLYSQLSDGSNVVFSSEAQGRGELKELMVRLKGRGKPICLLLDNVWKEEHLTKLLPQEEHLADALPCGSYLLITSRSEGVVERLASTCFRTQREKTEGYLYYPLRMLSKTEAEDLFLRKASMEEEKRPLHRDDDLVKAIVSLCGGLPLALTVYGSFFKREKRRTPAVWKRLLEQLKRGEDPRDADEQVFEILKTSVDFQDERLQDAFIRVVALANSDSIFNDLFRDYKRRDEVIESLVEEDDVDSLVDQSLVMRREGRFEIHDLLFNVFQKMLKEKNIWFLTNLTECSHEDKIAELLLTPPEVSAPIIYFNANAWFQSGQKSYPSSTHIRDVQYLQFDDSWCPDECIREFWLLITQHCHNLRMLMVNGQGVQEHFSWITKLRHLRWLEVEGNGDSFAGISKISSQLRVLKVRLVNNCGVNDDILSLLLEASFTDLRWLCIQGLQDPSQLKWVCKLGSLTKLEFSECTSSTLFQEIEQLELFGCMGLTSLALSGCTSLAALPQEIGQLGFLESLKLSKCTSLTALPKEIGQLGSLEYLDLSSCTSLAAFPEEIGQLSSLKRLDLSKCTSLAALPEEIGQLGSLSMLSLKGCTSLAELPRELGQLSSLEWLNLCEICTSLAALPQVIGELCSLKSLNLCGWTSLAELPRELGQLSSLEELNLSGCTSLAALPQEIGELRSLEVLDLKRCTSLAALPREIWQLSSMRVLYCSAALPREIGQLRKLRYLCLFKCTSLAALPQEIGQMRLARLFIDECTSLAALPPEVGQLGFLEELGLLNCTSLAALPQEVGCLRSLEELLLNNCTSLAALPRELGQLRSLKKLDLSGCTSLAALPREVGQLHSLKELDLTGCTSLAALPQELGQLGSLVELELCGCRSLAKVPQEVAQANFFNDVSLLNSEVNTERSYGRVYYIAKTQYDM